MSSSILQTQLNGSTRSGSLAGRRLSLVLKLAIVKEGWQHIDEHHISGTHADGPGDLFSEGTLRAQVQRACECLVKKGTRMSDPTRRIQTYEKRIRVNGRVDRACGVFDSHDGNRTITVFPVRNE